MTGRILTSHVGSLPRPVDLLDLFSFTDRAKFDALAEGARIASERLWTA